MNTTTCPTERSLEALIRGQTGELEEASLSDHVANCENCRSLMDRLESEHSDSLLDQLRGGDGQNGFQHEPGCQWATSLALGAIAGKSDEETHGEPFQLPLDLGDYRLLEPIAHGGMGVVYRAQHLRLGRDVAVKIISGRRLADKRAVQRFEAEMRTLGQLSHPNIVAALDARELSAQPVLIMEYVDGLDLSVIQKRLGTLPAEAVAAIGKFVAVALEYASRHGLVHRDVKPSNIMLNMRGEVKLLDLGLARLQAGQGADIDGTITGLALGTADYMSPEQIHDARNVDVRSDLYSLGCTLTKLLTGEAPYGGARYATNFSKLSAHVSVAPILLPNEYQIGAPELAKVIQALVAKNPDERPASAQEVANQLDRCSSEADLVQLVKLARSAPPLAEPVKSPATRSHLSGNSSRNDRRGLWGWLSPTIAAVSLPLGLFLGMFLTIKRPDGSTQTLAIPDNANVAVDSTGNVDVELKKSTKLSGVETSQNSLPFNRDSGLGSVNIRAKQDQTVTLAENSPQFGYAFGVAPPADDPFAVAPTDHDPFGGSSPADDPFAVILPSENPFGTDSTSGARLDAGPGNPPNVGGNNATKASPADNSPSTSGIAAVALEEAKNQAKEGETSITNMGSNTDKNTDEKDDRAIAAAMKAMNNNPKNAPLYRGYPFSEWKQLLASDRSVDVAKVAAQALCNLADLTEQRREVAQLIMERSRLWGSRITGNHDATSKWMEIVLEEYPKLFPEPGMEAIIEELNHGKSLRSLQACSYLLSASMCPCWAPPRDKRFLASFEFERAIALVHAFDTASLAVNDSTGNGDRDWTLDTIMRIALDKDLAFEQLPKRAQAYSKQMWRALATNPTDLILRNEGNTCDSITRNFAWLPYWRTLASSEQKPLTILHQIFQDQAYRDPLLDVPAILDRITSVTPDESRQIKIFIIERWADSDFDDRTESRREIWPAVLTWMVDRKILADIEAKKIDEIFLDTEKEFKSIFAIDMNVSGFFPRLNGSSYGHLPSESNLSKEQEAAVKMLRSEKKLDLLELLGVDLKDDLIFRLPGAARKGEEGKGMMGGGMF